MTTIETHATSAAPAGEGLALVAEWVTTTDHKRVGRLYLGTAALALLGSVVVAALLAFERIDINSTALDKGSLTQLFSLYRFGFTYLVLAPLLVGVAIAVVPLQVGARSLAFPRLAAAGFWAWLLGGVLGVYSLVQNGGPGGGDAVFVDMFTLSVVLTIVGLLAGLGSLAVTVLTTRAPGMNMRRVPFFSWSVLVSSLTLLVALPIVVGDLLYVFVAHRYPSISELSGNLALGKWAGFGFTQPVTLLLALPVLGFLVETLATATRSRVRPRGVVLAAIGLVGTSVYAAAVQTDVVISSPFRSLDGGEAVKQIVVFAMVHVLPLLGVFLAVALGASSLARKPRITAAPVFGLLAGLLLLIGAAANAVAHVADAGLGGTVFEEGAWLAVVYAGVLAAMGAVAYWGPKWWGRTLADKAVLPLALLGFVGALLASAPLLIAGFVDQPGGVFPVVEPGQTTNVVDFPNVEGPHALWNVLSFAGHVLVVLAVLAFVALALRGFLTGERAGDDPWDGLTLEWATSSPAPLANFAEVHIVQSAEPLLDLKPNRSDA